MSGLSVDLNSDLGEGFGPWRMGDDEALIDVVSSVNIACGFHAGDPLIMARTVALAKRRGLGVGAHPGINDLWGYGRRRIEGDSPADLATMVAYQIGALMAISRRQGCRVGHVKLHGQLSNAAAVDPVLAGAIATAISDVEPALIWLVPSASEMAEAGEAAGLTVRHEVFADRAYDDAGDLLPRSRPGAVLDDPQAIAGRAVTMVRQGGVHSATGRFVPLRVDSICVHGDTPGAVEAARGLRASLEAAGIAIAPMAGA